VLHVRNNDPCRRKAMNPIDNFNAASADVWWLRRDFGDRMTKFIWEQRNA
jgi:hypothetical protein